MVTRIRLAGALALLAAAAAAGADRASFVEAVPWVATLTGLAVLGLLAGGEVPARPRAWAWALAVRLPLLLAPCALSDDVWRYVWEGMAWREGLNPFVHAPDSAALAHLRAARDLFGQQIWPQVAHKAIPSIYPPGAQGLFAGLAPLGVLGFRVLAAGADVGTAEVLARRDPRAGLLWALLPLPAMESAVSGHLEGVGVLAWVLGMGLARGGTPAGASLRVRAWAAWLGGMLKILPALLLLRAGWRRALLGGALALALSLPMVTLDAPVRYATTWSFHAGPFVLAELLLGGAARPALQVLGALVVGTAALRVRDPASLALWGSGALVILSPVVHPWYALWPLAASLVRGGRAWSLFAALLPLSYTVLASYDPATSRWEEPGWTRWVTWGPFLGALSWEAWKRASRPGPSPP
jgi:alpha-1,6-mannosyltransferase